MQPRNRFQEGTSAEIMRACRSHRMIKLQRGLTGILWEKYEGYPPLDYSPVNGLQVRTVVPAAPRNSSIMRSQLEGTGKPTETSLTFASDWKPTLSSALT